MFEKISYGFSRPDRMERRGSMTRSHGATDGRMEYNECGAGRPSSTNTLFHTKKTVAEVIDFRGYTNQVQNMRIKEEAKRG